MSAPGACCACCACWASCAGLWLWGAIAAASMDSQEQLSAAQKLEKGRSALLSRAIEGSGDVELGSLLRALAARVETGLNCLALIGDPLHQDVFGRAFYKRLGPIPVFKVLVQENEDLLSPNYRTLKVIRQVRKEGCRAYFLLFANGVQLSRLLRFGDSHRELDTRAQFVLLYDRRLLGTDLHYLWKKIVNVVFVRRFGGPWSSGSDAGRRSSWFELSTVPFPAPIQDVLVTRRLDIWRRGAFRQNSDLFQDKTSDLQNQTLPVVTFQHVPASYRTGAGPGTGTDEFSGLEVQVVLALARAMNFQPRLYEAPNAELEQWGRRQLDGTMSGLLGEATSGRAELVLGDLHYTPYHLQLLDLSVPYHVECLTFLTPESTTDNSWQTLILPFKPGVWLAVGLSLLIAGVVFFILARTHAHLEDMKLHQPEEQDGQRLPDEASGAVRFGEALVSRVGEGVRRLPLTSLDCLRCGGAEARAEDKAASRVRAEAGAEVGAEALGAVEQLTEPATAFHIGSRVSVADSSKQPKSALHLFADSLCSAMLYTMGMLLGVSLPRIPTGWAVRVMTGWWWLYSILVVVAYRAAMTAILANPAPRITIDSLEQLGGSSLSVGGWGQHQKEFFETSLDEAGQKVGRKFEVTADWKVAVERVALGSFAYYENSHFLRYAKANRRRRVLSQQGGHHEGNSSVGNDSAASGTNITRPTEDRDRVDTMMSAKASNLTDIRAVNLTTQDSSNPRNETLPTASTAGSLEERNLHIMRDCVINMPISLGLQKNSALKPRVDRFLRRVIEAGMVHKWLADAMLATAAGRGGRGFQDEEEPVKALMELRKLYGALVALGAGYALSAVALLAELLLYHGLVARRSGFDIYATNRGIKDTRWRRLGVK